MLREIVVLLVQLLARLATLLGSRGARAVVAENSILKHQLLVIQRSRHQAPNLRPADRWLFGFCSLSLSRRRLLRAAIILRPSTLLRCHRQLKQFKYRVLYSSSPKGRPGPRGPAPDLIQSICELKRRDPRFGCPKLAQHLAKTFGIDLDKDVVHRVLAA
jgi:putative transposase